MERLSTLSDKQLLEQFQSGDSKAFELIYDRYWQLLFRHARYMLRNDEEAKDVVQDVFTTLWQRASANQLDSPLAPFLYTATRNKILNMLKHFKIEARYLDHLKAVLNDTKPVPTEQLLIENELARKIEDGIQSLPAKMREIFLLSRKEYKTHQEISHLLNISDKTVKRQVSNALFILKGKLGLFINLF